MQLRAWRYAAASLLAALGGATAPAADAPNEFPAGPGQGAVHAACAPCHAISVVTSARKSQADWAGTVDAMITRGAQVPDDDYDAIVDYLVRNFSAPAPDAGAASPRPRSPI
jgi:quinoprotein glucose dehydrogenase